MKVLSRAPDERKPGAADLKKSRQPGKSGVGDVRRKNLQLIVSSFVGNTEKSRIQIAQETGLSPSTVGSLVSELLQEGVLQESGGHTGTGGRSRTNLCLNPDYGLIFVFEIRRSGVWVTDFDLNLQARHFSRIADHCLTGNDLMKRICESIESRTEKEKLLGIGLLMQQDMKTSDFRVMYNTGYDSASISLKEALITQYHVNVTDEYRRRYTVTSALHEAQETEEEKTDFVHILLGRKIQACVTLGGQTVPLRDEFCNAGKAETPGEPQRGVLAEEKPESGRVASLIVLLCMMFSVTKVFLTGLTENIDAAYFDEVKKKVRKGYKGSPPEMKLIKGTSEEMSRGVAWELREELSF